LNPSLTIYRGRFALLWHELPTDAYKEKGPAHRDWVEPEPENGSHWDLMLELDSGELLTWRLPGRPLSDLLSDKLPFMAVQLPNHRIAYLDYQGPVSGNRGRVERVASGFYRCNVVDQPNTNCEPSASQEETSLADSQSATQRTGPEPWRDQLQSTGPIPLQLCNRDCWLRVELQGVCEEAEFRSALEIELSPAGPHSTCRVF
jgi:hypothetical protein